MKELERHGVQCEAPDDYLASLYDAAPELMVSSLANARRNLSNTQVSRAEFVRILQDQRLVGLAKRIQTHVDDL
jgi:hypothetical protein